MKARAELRTQNKYRSKLEEAYASHLASLQLAGMIHSWRFEPMGFNLGIGSHYYPDFMVVKNCGGIEFHETKAQRGKGKRVQLGETKLKLAAKQFPEFTWRLIHKDKTGFKQTEIANVQA